MEGMPQDPMILFGYVNMKLRDRYATLDELCDDMHISREELESKLGEAGFEFNSDANKFW